MIGFVQGDGGIAFSHLADGPRGNHGAGVAVDDVDGGLAAIIDVHLGARFFDGHGFDAVGGNLDFADLFFGVGIDDGDVGIGNIAVFTAVDDVEIFAGGIVEAGI